MTEISAAAAPEDVADRRPHPEGGEHGSHPTDVQYIIIAARASTIVNELISRTNELTDV